MGWCKSRAHWWFPLSTWVTNTMQASAPMHLGITTMEVILRTALPAAALTVLVGKSRLGFLLILPCRALPRNTSTDLF